MEDNKMNVFTRKSSRGEASPSAEKSVSFLITTTAFSVKILRRAS